MYIKPTHRSKTISWMTVILLGACSVLGLSLVGFLYWLGQHYDFGLDQSMSYFLRYAAIGTVIFLSIMFLHIKGNAPVRKLTILATANILVISFGVVITQGSLYKLFLAWPLTLCLVILFFYRHQQIKRILTFICANSLILLALASPFIIRGTSAALLEAFYFRTEVYLLLSSTAIVTAIALLRQKYTPLFSQGNSRIVLINLLFVGLGICALIWCAINWSQTAISNIIPILILITIALTANNYPQLIIDKEIPEKYLIHKRVGYLGWVLFALFMLRLLFLRWDSGYGNFHSGESIFFGLIQNFGAGSFGALATKSQSIMVLLFGYFESLFRELGIASKISLRLVMNIISFANIYLVFKVAQLLFAQHIRKNTIALLSTLFLGFNYFFIFFGNLIRPDALIALTYNLFFYFLLKDRTLNFVVLSFIAGVALAFKGNGLLLVVLNLGAFIAMKFQPGQHISQTIKAVIQPTTLLSLVIIFGLTLSTFYLLTPYAHSNILDSFFTIQKGLERFGVGHYGRFPTNVPILEMYGSRISLIAWAFSPLILLFPAGVLLFLRRINPVKRFYSLNRQELLHIFITLATIVFFIFILRKPIQFARYYFPFVTLFFIYLSYALVELVKKKTALYLAVGFYIVFNLSFYQHMLHNSRIDAYNILASLPDDVIYVPVVEKGWKRPPKPDNKIYRNITSLSEVPPGGHLLVPQHLYSLYGHYVLNPEKYKPSDWYPSVEPNEDIRTLYTQLIQMEPKYIVSKKNLFLFENSNVPYDIWYMTHPDYYLYQL